MDPQGGYTYRLQFAHIIPKASITAKTRCLWHLHGQQFLSPQSLVTPTSAQFPDSHSPCAGHVQGAGPHKLHSGANPAKLKMRTCTPQQRTGGAATSRCHHGLILQPRLLHALPRMALSLSKAPPQLEQQQPCSSDACGESHPQQQQEHPTQLQQQQHQQPALSSQLPLLPLIASHQLWMTLHGAPAHAFETMPPEAAALLREFLVGVVHAADVHACMHAWVDGCVQ